MSGASMKATKNNIPCPGSCPCAKPVSMGSRGQAFEPFNLLIGAIIALTMLAIIISAVNYFDEKKFEVSRQKFNEGVINAVKQPNGEPLQAKNIYLRRGTTVSTIELGNIAGLSSECFDIKPIDGTSMVRRSEGVFEMRQDVLTTVVMSCKTNTSSGCEIGCELGFLEEG